MRTASHALEKLGQRLSLLDPKAILDRGYSIAVDSEGHIVRDATRLRVGERVIVEVARGRFESEVVKIGEGVSARV